MIKYLIISSLLVFSFITRAGSDPKAEKESFKVVGYQAAWGEIKNLDYKKLTHINYSFAIAKPDGTLEPVLDPEKLKKLVKNAHEHNVDVRIAVGGWNDGDDRAFETLAKTISARKTFTEELLKLVKKYDLDGVDLDWEYPDEGESAIHFASLVTELSVALKAEEKSLSIAVVSHGKTGEGVSKEVFAHIDMLNVMAYDGKDHGSYEQAEKSISYWQKRGCPKEKIILGLPFYGRSPYVSYRDLLEKDPEAHSKDKVGKVNYNGKAMITKKTKLAMISCGGVMIWELSQDASPVHAEHSLLKAIDDAIRDTKKGTQE